MYWLVMTCRRRYQVPKAFHDLVGDDGEANTPPTLHILWIETEHAKGALYGSPCSFRPDEGHGIWCRKEGRHLIGAVPEGHVAPRVVEVRLHALAARLLATIVHSLQQRLLARISSPGGTADAELYPGWLLPANVVPVQELRAFHLVEDTGTTSSAAAPDSHCPIRRRISRQGPKVPPAESQTHFLKSPLVL